MTDTVPAPAPAPAPAQPLIGLPAVIRIGNDLVDWVHLPEAVRTKLRELRRLRDDASAVMRGILDEQREVWDSKRTAEARLKELTGSRADSPFYDRFRPNYYRLEDDHPEVAAQLVKLEAAKAEIERLAPIIETRKHVFNQRAGLVTSIERYLTERLGRVRHAISLYSGPEPSRQKREFAVDAVERCRRRLRELDADRHRVASAPWPCVEPGGARVRKSKSLPNVGNPAPCP